MSDDESETAATCRCWKNPWHPRKALNPLKGLSCSRVTGLTITAYLLSITSTCLAQQCRDVKPVSVSRGAYLLRCFLGSFREQIRGGSAKESGTVWGGATPLH